MDVGRSVEVTCDLYNGLRSVIQIIATLTNRTEHSLDFGIYIWNEHDLLIFLLRGSHWLKQFECHA